MARNDSLKEVIRENNEVKFPEGFCCGNVCRDCRYIEMDNDFWNDGTRRCAYRGEWVRPSNPACGNFSL